MPEQPTLSDMIKAAADSGLTYLQLQERSIDPHDGAVGISAAQLNRIANGNANRIPDANQLRAIATALRQPYERVRQAAIAQWLPAEAEPEQESTDREQMRQEVLELRNQLTAALEAIDRIDATPQQSKRPKSA